MNDLVTIGVYGQRFGAEAARGLLDEQGIESIVTADDCGGNRPHLALGTGGVQLVVRKEDVQKAQEVLKILEKA